MVNSTYDSRSQTLPKAIGNSLEDTKKRTRITGTSSSLIKNKSVAAAPLLTLWHVDDKMDE